MGTKPLYLKIAALCGLFLVASVFLISCSDDPPTGATGDTDVSGQGNIDPSGSKDFLLGSVAFDGAGHGRIDVWAFNLTIGSDNTVSFDIVLSNESNTTIYPPVIFWITQIIPDGVYVLNSDIVYIASNPIREGPPGFIFSDKLGDDGKLDPGEHTSSATIKFGMEELTSFSIGFRIEVGSPPDDFAVSGTVFHDANRNGKHDVNEPGIPGMKVTLTNDREDSTMGPEILRVAETNDRGHYGFRDVDAGIYTVQAHVPVQRPNDSTGALVPTTPNPLIVTLLGDGEGGVIPLKGVNFGFVPEGPPFEPVFGPVAVGPGSFNGETFEGSFFLRSEGPLERYILDITPPHITTQTGVLMFVEHVKVTINEMVAFEWVCDSADSTVVAYCAPVQRVELSPRLLVGGENRIEIGVEGNDRAVVLFTISQLLNDYLH